MEERWERRESAPSTLAGLPWRLSGVLLFSIGPPRAGRAARPPIISSTTICTVRYTPLQPRRSTPSSCRLQALATSSARAQGQRVTRSRTTQATNTAHAIISRNKQAETKPRHVRMDPGKKPTQSQTSKMRQNYKLPSLQATGNEQAPRDTASPLWGVKHSKQPRGWGPSRTTAAGAARRMAQQSRRKNAVPGILCWLSLLPTPTAPTAPIG